jgi:hypothetical protein
VPPDGSIDARNEWTLTGRQMGSLDLANSGAVGAEAAPLYNFVSAPDTWNADVAHMRKGPRDSINASWRRATDAVLAQLASSSPAFALVAGDLVNGHWHKASRRRPIARLAAARRAVRKRGDVYYGAWKAMFRRHGLTARPAVGDHDLGDDPWATPLRRALVPAFRAEWARWFTRAGRRFRYALHPPRGTQHAASAYAFARPPVLFVTVDVFHRRRDGSVRVEVVGRQLRWLRRVLRDANHDPAIQFIVVQGHVPALPVSRGFHSSELSVGGGASSAFWRTLAAAHVDLYLAGEFHRFADARVRGVEQIVHGSILGAAAYNYLRVDVFPDRLAVRLYVARVWRVGSARMWQIGNKWPLAQVVVGPFVSTGSMEITDDGRAVRRTGCFMPRAYFAPGGEAAPCSRHGAPRRRRAQMSVRRHRAATVRRPEMLS